MKSEITLLEKVADQVNRHALDTFPNECCGFLFGSEKNGRIIDKAWAAANVREGDQRRRFEISPLDYLRAEQFALDNGTRLLGIYHSHPNHPAIASEYDLAQAMPYFSYLIISVMDGKVADLKSWKLKDGIKEFSEEQLTISQSINL